MYICVYVYVFVNGGGVKKMTVNEINFISLFLIRLF